MTGLLAAKRRLRIVEFGAGGLRNAAFLLDRGHDVTVVELPATGNRFSELYADFIARGGKLSLWEEVVKRPKRRHGAFDLAIITFVIETICQSRMRLRMLRECLHRLKVGGSLLISVRGISDVEPGLSKGLPCSDGYLTPLHTFARSYTCDQLRTLLSDSGFTAIEMLHKSYAPAPELINAIAKRAA